MISTRQSRKRLARQKQMLDVAMGIVEEEGIKALTIARLAEGLDAAVGAIYRYFPSKQALLSGLQRQALERFGEDLRARIEATTAALCAQGLDPDREAPAALCRLSAALCAYLDDAQLAPDRHRLIDELISTPEVLFDDADLPTTEGALGPVLGLVGALIDRAVALGALGPGDAAQRTHVAWAALHGLDHFRKRDRLQPPHLQMAALTAAMIRTLLIGWGAAPKEVDAAMGLWGSM